MPKINSLTPPADRVENRNLPLADCVPAFCRRTLLPVFIFTAIILGTVGYMWLTSPPVGSVVELPAYRSHNLGEGKPHQTLRGKFRLRSVGSEPVEFKLSSSCGCTSLEPRTGTIFPGDVQIVDFALRLGNLGTERTADIWVETNDSNQSYNRLHIHGICPAPLTAKPSSIDFGNVARGRQKTATVDLFAKGGHPLTDSDSLTFESSNPRIAVTSLRTASGALQLAVKLDTGKCDARIYGIVRISISAPDLEIRLPVRANVCGPVRVVPPNVALRTLGENREANFLVIRMDGQSLGSIRPLDLPEGLELQELSGPTDKRRRFRLLAGDHFKPNQTVEIKLRIANLEELVTVHAVIND